MNKRQKKKAYKKKYGYNPPKPAEFNIKVDWSAFSQTVQETGKRAAETIDYISKVLMPEFVELLNEAAKDLGESVKDLSAAIKTMSEEEWQKFRKELKEQELEKAEKIRQQEGNADERTSEMENAVSQENP